MAFMQPEIWRDVVCTIEDKYEGEQVCLYDCIDKDTMVYAKLPNGDFDFVPLKTCGDNLYDEPEIQLNTYWIARLSAPGYLDATDIACYDNYHEAVEYLLDMYYDGPWDEMSADEIQQALGLLRELPRGHRCRKHIDPMRLVAAIRS